MASDKKKILMFCHRTPPYHGVSIMGDLIFNTFNEDNISVKYVNISISSTVHRNKTLFLKKAYLLFGVFIQYFRAIISFKPDYIYITPTISDSGFYRDFIIVQLTKIYNYIKCNKINIYLHIHMRPYRVSYFQKNILFPIFFRGTNVIFLSKKLLVDFDKKIFENSQLYFLPNIILQIADQYDINNSLIKFKNLNYETIQYKKHVTYLGHLIETKGYRRALEIAKKLINKDKNIVFSFFGEFGDSTEKKYFFDFIKNNNLQNEIKYNGFCERENLWVALKDTHLMIFPSYTEAYPLTILEAISVGIPVVATNTGAISEIIGNVAGKVVDNSISESVFINNFTSSIEFLLNKWSYEDSINCINYYNQNWNYKIFKKNLIKIFNIN